jgi:hypothetical protein
MEQEDREHPNGRRSGPNDAPAGGHAAEGAAGRAAWMAGGWGIMHHYRDDGTGGLESFNEQTDRFDVDALAGLSRRGRSG